MIKSTKTSLKFCNRHRIEEISSLIEEYRNVMRQFIKILWEREKISRLADKETCAKIETWLSARMVQCAGKQASAIIIGTRKKQEKRKYMIGKLISEGNLKKAKSLQRIYDETAISMPNIDRIEMELDSRFVTVDFSNDTSFDGWLVVSSIGKKMKISIPFKKTRHFNRLVERGGVFHHGIRLSKNAITFMLEMPEPKQTKGKVLGIDIGLKDVLSCSNGQQIGIDRHGWTYQRICQKLARKKKGSKAFARVQRHRENFLHWCVNQIDWNGVGVLQRENIRNLRKFKHSRRDMQAWNYAELFRILDGKASDAGVRIQRLSPTYTSQRCCKCGYTKKENRKGKTFKCLHCGNTMDADMNAAQNLSLPLEEIQYGNRRRFDNQKGFFWNENQRSGAYSP